VEQTLQYAEHPQDAMKEIMELSNAKRHEENELVRQVREGNRQAFTELVTRYQQDIYKLAYGFFQDRDDAMEIVQETFMRVYEKIDRYGQGSTENAFRNWMYRIAYNLCIDFYRKFKKKKTDDKELYEFLESRDRETTNPESDMDRIHFKHTLKKSVMDLSKRQQMVFMLKHYSDLKHQEISNILDLSVGTVKSLYHRAIKNLGKRLVRFEVAK
jgi:RNA polymerase sigma-70 factor (ECF subfamily)